MSGVRVAQSHMRRFVIPLLVLVVLFSKSGESTGGKDSSTSRIAFRAYHRWVRGERGEEAARRTPQRVGGEGRGGEGKVG